MTLEVIEAETGRNPTASIIVLHGLGADGNDFVPVADAARPAARSARSASSFRTRRRGR